MLLRRMLIVEPVGLCTAIDMIKSGQGRNFVIVEKGNQVGGTWNDNIYPGCCCDGMSLKIPEELALNGSYGLPDGPQSLATSTPTPSSQIASGRANILGKRKFKVT